MKLIIPSLILLWLTSPMTHGQQLIYDVIRNDESMGSTIVIRTASDEKVSYHLNTKTSFRILFKFEVEYELKENFSSGVLQTGTGFNTLNGSVQKEIELFKRAEYYALVMDGIDTKIRETSILNSVSEVYFEEPYDNKKVFSAYFGRFLSFDQTGEHSYKLVSPDGTNEYTYENGICVSVKISRDFATFSQILQPELLAAVRNNQYANSISK